MILKIYIDLWFIIVFFWLIYSYSVNFLVQSFCVIITTVYTWVFSFQLEIFYNHCLLTNCLLIDFHLVIFCDIRSFKLHDITIVYDYSSKIGKNSINFCLMICICCCLLLFTFILWVILSMWFFNFLFKVTFYNYFLNWVL